MSRGIQHIGLTGGIGSGKTTFASLLQAQGAALIDSDQIAREVAAPGGAAIPAIQQAFGEAYIDSQGGLDRARMRQLVYEHPEARTRLESIIHPLVSRGSQEQALAAEAKGHKVIVFDVPLLVESRRWAQRLDSVIVLDCPAETQIRRVMARSGLDRVAVEAIMKAHATRKERLRAADIVIHNGDDVSCTHWNFWHRKPLPSSGYDVRQCLEAPASLFFTTIGAWPYFKRPGTCQRDPLRIPLQRTAQNLSAAGTAVQTAGGADSTLPPFGPSLRDCHDL
jgi:dephospho-CoA kinase